MKVVMSELISTSSTVLVTGATDGIGYQTARRFVEDGANVYLHAPDSDSGEQAIERLVKGGAEPLRLHPVIADFTCLDDVANLADMLTVTLPKLDTLVNNAAVVGPERRTYTPDGHEIAFQVNYLAAYLLTTKLTDKIGNAGGRVVNVSSVAHRGGNIFWKSPGMGYQYSPLAVYAQSKLALTMHTKTLAETHGDSITALSVHPGVFDTRLLPLYAHTGRPAEHAAQVLTTIGSPTFPVENGGYHDGLAPDRAAALVDNARARKRLEKITVDLLGSLLD